MTEDAELLLRYAKERDNAAFAELVRRYVDLVHSAAVRQVGGDEHLAWDVTQGVFLALAHSAPALVSRPIVVSWLYKTTRFTAANMVRARQRARAREREDHSMRDTTHEPDWQAVRPVLDETMHELEERDREAVLLRHFEGRSFAEIGKVCGGLSENAARMRVERALEKLRTRLARRGITSTAVALGGVLSAQAVTAAPAGLAVAAGAMAHAGAGAALGWGVFMSATKMKIAVAGALAVLGVGALMVTHQWLDARDQLAQSASQAARQEREMLALRDENRTQRAQAPVRGVKTESVASTREATVENGKLTAPALRMLVDLQREGLIRDGLSITEVEGTVAPGWARALGLSDAEVVRFNAALVTARQQLGRHELANSRAEVLPDGRVVITVQPFPEGAAVYDELIGTLSTLLGPERFQVFSAFGMKRLEDQLNHLGLATRVLTLTHDRSKAGQRTEYSMTSRVTHANGGINQGGASDRRLDGLITFLLGPLVTHVPPGF